MAANVRSLLSTYAGLWTFPAPADVPMEEDDSEVRLELIVRQAQEQGEVNPSLDPSAVARLLVVAVEGLMLHKVIDSEVDVRTYAQVLKALYSGGFWRGGGGAPDGKR
jgi:hypothetical protein